MSAINEESMNLLIDTIMGIKAVAKQARKDFPKDGQNDAMAVIMHAAAAAYELVANELLLPKDDDEDEPDAPAGDGKPPRLTVVD